VKTVSETMIPRYIDKNFNHSVCEMFFLHLDYLLIAQSYLCTGLQTGLDNVSEVGEHFHYFV